MTAINVYVREDESHIFSDGGNYRADTLELSHLGSKVLPLPGLVGALAWSGETALGFDLMRRVEPASPGNLWDWSELVVRQLRRVTDKYSVVLVSPGLAIAVQEGGRIDQLRAGAYVKSVPTDADFDPEDVRGSGLAMMRDQRSSGIVHGYCQHTIVRADSLHSEIVERWPR